MDLTTTLLWFTVILFIVFAFVGLFFILFDKNKYGLAIILVCLWLTHVTNMAITHQNVLLEQKACEQHLPRTENCVITSVHKMTNKKPF